MTMLDRVGHVTQEPVTWAGIAVALGAAGDRGRRAAMRGVACFGLAAITANILMKPIVQRRRPEEAEEQSFGPVTSSFPSGHAAADLAFAVGAAQEMPLLFLPLAAATVPAHWSLVRSGGHHMSDVFAGGVLGIAVAWVVWRLWPVGGRRDAPESARSDPERRERSRPADRAR